LGEEVSELGFEDLMEKYEEARVIREFEVGIMCDAITRAFGGKK
jgi:hypothetical protein